MSLTQLVNNYELLQITLVDYYDFGFYDLLNQISEVIHGVTFEEKEEALFVAQNISVRGDSRPFALINN